MESHITTGGNEGFARKLDTASWGLFIIWTGIAILVDVGWGWALFGVAAIILGTAVVRWLRALPVDGFWIAMGFVLLICAFSEFFALSWPLLPVLIIGFGAWVLLRAFVGSQTGAH